MSLSTAATIHLHVSELMVFTEGDATQENTVAANPHCVDCSDLFGLTIRRLALSLCNP